MFHPRYWLLLSLALIISSFIDCQEKEAYNFILPPEGEQLESLFPQSIDAISADKNCVEEWSKSSCHYEYGSIARIHGYTFTSQQDATEFYRDHIQHLQFNTSQIQETDECLWMEYTHLEGYKGLVWQIKHWVFEIKAPDENTFNKVIAAFQYVSR